MKISKLIYIVRRKANGETRKMLPSEISATFALARVENSDILKVMCETDGSDLSKIIEVGFNVGRKAAYDDVLYMLEERQEMERSGNVRRLLAQLRDNGVTIEGGYVNLPRVQGKGKKWVVIDNLPQDVEL